MIKIVALLIACLFSTFGVSFVYYNFSDAKIHFKWPVYLLYILGVLFLTFVKMFDLKYISLFSYFIFYPILFWKIKPLPLNKFIFYVLFIWLCGTFLDLFSMLIVSMISFLFHYDISSNMDILTIVMSFFVFDMLIILGKSVTVKRLVNKLWKSISSFKFADLALILFSIFTFIIGYAIFSNLRNLKSGMLLNIILLLVLLVFIVLFRFKVYSAEETKFLETLKENNELYIKTEEENSIFKHNLMAKLLSIKSVSNKKAAALVDDLILQFSKSIHFSEKMRVVPYGINGIIYQKLNPYLDEINVNISNNVRYDIFTVLKPRRYNVFVEKMVIALDNAIEACLNSTKKILTIDLYDEEDFIVIEIRNTFSNEIDISLLGTKNYSSKGKKRGWGIFSSFRNSEAILKVSIINDQFVSKISAKKKIT